MADVRPLAFQAKGSPLNRCLAFIRIYFDAPDDADIEFRGGHADTGEAAVLVDVNGSRHAFTVSEARSIADIAERTLNDLPVDGNATGLPNLILGMRFAADKSEADLANPHPEGEGG
jgi:hypothetical protein